MPGSPGQSAGAWLGPDGETVFGSEPYEDRTYWSSLVHFVRERSGHGFSAPHSKAVACRLVVFSATKAPVNLSSWMPPDEIIESPAFDTLNAELVEFARCIAEKRPYPVAIDQVLHGMSVFDAVVRSGKSGQIEKVD